MKAVLTIAGSDCSGGAGIQADIKTIVANGVYAMSIITAMTAQNTMGVIAISCSTPKFLEQQLDCIFKDIPPDAVKIGMLPSAELMRVVAQKLQQYQIKQIVLDPVMVATSGAILMPGNAVEILKTKLFPFADLITPNIFETEILTNRSISSREDMLAAAKFLSDKHHCAVLCKGGHRLEDANDVLYHKGHFHWFENEHIDNPNTHGTGCTLSSAIAANLAKGYSIEDAIKRAKQYISGALAAMLNLGQGSGPIHHGFDLKSKYIT